MKKTKKVTFIPKNDYVIEYASKPEPMSKNFPTWWRKSDPYVGGVKKVMGGQYNSTVKKCPGIQDLLTTGYLLKTPCDIYIDTTGDELIYEVSETHASSITLHSPDQVTAWEYDTDRFTKDVFRIHPMWVIATEKGYSTLFIHPSFHNTLPFETVPAIIDTDMYASDGPFSVKLKRGFKGVIEAGTPLVQCIPYKREEFESIILEKPDLRILNSLIFKIKYKFGLSYKTLMWERKVFK